MKTPILLLVAALSLAAIGPTACRRGERGVEAAGEKPDKSNVLTTADRDFMRRASQAHIQEIDMARLSEEKATNSDVKDYAGMLISEHEKALHDLNSIMDRNNVPYPNVEPKDQAQLHNLGKLTTAQFDRSFLEMMVSSHSKALENYQTEMKSVQNSELKDHVTDFIPIIEKDLNRAEQLQSQLGGGSPKTTQTR
jgi:putative membrane protein